MADLGFLPVVTRLLAATPANGQRLLFSATLDNGVDKIVSRFLDRPVTHAVDDATSTVEAMSHAVFEVDGADAKRRVLEALASGSDRRILFVRTKHVAKRLAKQLAEAGVAAVDLQGNLSQAARDRNLAAFSDGSARVLVATDVAARGVHVDDVALVVHVDPPTEHKAYLHRSGRTARAGSAGTVVTLVLPEQRKDVAVLLRKAGISVTPESVTADSASVARLVGERAPKVAPPARVAAQQPSRPRRAPQGAAPRARTGAQPHGRGGQPQARAGRPVAAGDARRGGPVVSRSRRGGR
jgi:superfamily II DNA/RNA helicase